MVVILAFNFWAISPAQVNDQVTQNWTGIFPPSLYVFFFHFPSELSHTSSPELTSSGNQELKPICMMYNSCAFNTCVHPYI